MASSMVAITTDGTRVGCAGISLTESGIAVLNEGGSRLGFVPYGSLQYVTPCVEDQGAEDGTGLSGDLEVVAADGSAFSCASLSQTAAGLATLAPSGERTGFVPYDTLEYVLPDGETGDASVDCTLPPAVAGAADAAENPADETGEATAKETAEADEAADPVEEEAERGDDETDEESDGVWEDAEDEAASDESAEESDTSDETGDDEEDDLWEEAEDSTDPVDPETPVVEEEAAAEGSADAEVDAGGETTEEDTTTEGDSQRAEREEAGESEMQVEWSFGEYDE